LVLFAGCTGRYRSLNNFISDVSAYFKFLQAARVKQVIKVKEAASKSSSSRSSKSKGSQEEDDGPGPYDEAIATLIELFEDHIVPRLVI
jgi:hypothetical protein